MMWELLLLLPGIVAAVLVFVCGAAFGYEHGRRAGSRAGRLEAGAKCDYFFSYPGERCRLAFGHKGRHIPPCESIANYLK